MTRVFLGIVVLIIVLYGALYLATPQDSVAQPSNGTATSTIPASMEPAIIAENLDIPWDIAFLPDNSMLVTERPGALLHIDPANGSNISIPVAVATRGESGLLGVVIHPQFESNRYVYLYMSSGGVGQTTNRVVRYIFSDNTLTEDKVIISGIPGATYHDGGRMEFGPDGKLYVTTGDATRAAIAQDIQSLGGKILRLNDDGTIPSDNPYSSAVWSSGHRNPQGLAWDVDGNLWQTEHGPTGEGGRCCHDEVNKIIKGGNYGWPAIIGNESRAGMLSPAWHSSDGTWAPASLVYHEGSLFFGGLIAEGLYEATVENGAITSVTKHLDGMYGRIRTIRVGPDNMLYLTTSNTDGRGNAGATDDRIIRINPQALSSSTALR